MTGRTPPLGDNQGLWLVVLAAAAGRCQCRGTCGKKHDKDGGRCKTVHGTGPVRLRAAPAEPADLLLPSHKAAALPKTALIAWCPECHDATRRAAAKAREADAPATEPDALF
ncbi:hypothetical protein ACFC1R_08350 [Kitasatospora sp. NPDC056138]|uniref:hypothetical protein n=1 Tax=Kitasatospora sp. NPDC056138 TaxID=3345724 RepID=UPI0035DFE49B